jgi:hypothetical protein
MPDWSLYADGGGGTDDQPDGPPSDPDEWEPYPGDSSGSEPDTPPGRSVSAAARPRRRPAVDPRYARPVQRRAERSGPKIQIFVIRAKGLRKLSLPP